ncbi:MAG TPA: N-acetyl-gamma-glutamyl-phosphate reductase, partial [Methylophaga sp.]|nr:N-acetyl-gamma-glutamyl-phosphate reductase [Methylophaga sp.]
MIKVAIVGGTGYTGVELLRLLVNHPEVEIRLITSRSEAGMPVADMFPNLRGHLDLQFSEPDEAALAECDVVFFATPHTVAMSGVPALLKRGVRVIDLSADFRLKDTDLWAQWYNTPHTCPEYVEQAVYGLPELNRDAIRDAQLVAVAGCYPTAVQLGFYPLLKAGLIDPMQLIADAKSGTSGAGRKAALGTLLTEAGESTKAYGVKGHRHLPEIRQTLTQMAGGEIGLTFVPHLIPMIRGIHATLYGRLQRQVDLQALFEQHYADEPFVDVMPAGAHPETRS